jgi:hypothetical protein
MLQIAIIAFFAVVIVFLSSIQERKRLRRFLERGCAGFRWRRRFPQASKAEIREFLDIFVEAFGFKRSWRLSFAPDDRVMDVYRTLYSAGSLTDNMELESLVGDLQKRFGVDILGSWREDITLADLFTQTRRPVA